MRLLVTGGAGFIGSATVREAIARGHEVLVYDKLTYAANLAALASVSSAPGYKLKRADICDMRAVRDALSAFQPDAILHLAAETHVDRSIDGPSPFIDTNVVGTYTLLEAAREHWISLDPKARDAFRFIHISTDEVFGSLGAEGSFTEQSPYRPRSPYSASKAASDHLARAWQETYGLPVIVTNCSNNYGPFQFPEKLIPVVILRALEGQSIPVYGKGENVRDWLFVEDHARALLDVLAKGRIGETYNIGGNSECRNIDLVTIICRELDRHCPAAAPHEKLISFVVDRPGHDFRYAIDATKITSELGWQPSVSLEEGIGRTVKWFLANTAWWQGVKESGYRLERVGLKTGLSS